MFPQRAFRVPQSHLLPRRVVVARSICAGLYSRSGAQAGDPHRQSFEAGQSARQNPQNTEPLDAANPHSSKKAERRDVSGNPEGVGFAEQVGSQSSSENRGSRASSYEGVSGQENITPSFADSIKNKLGLKTTAGGDKQNQGGGEGMTGTGKPRLDSGKRLMSTGATLWADKTTKGQAPGGSRVPKERTNAEQNPHLRHRSSAPVEYSGKGNAAAEPSVPSHKFNGNPKKSVSPQARSFSTSVRVSNKETKHTAESYFKDVDSSPPSSAKTHQVDSGNTGADIQRPHESTTGEFSQSGVGSKEYQTVSKENPYDVPPSSGSGKEQKLRYGGKPNLDSKENQEQVSSPGEGPEGESKGGRQPEGRT